MPTDPMILKYFGLLDEDKPEDNFQTQAKLESYYDQNQREADRAVDPGFMGSQTKDKVGDYFAGRDPQLYAALAKSEAQVGTLHGKVADSSAVQDFANAIGDQRDRLSKIDIAQQQDRDRKTGLRLNVLKYLNEKYQDQNKAYGDRLSKYGEGELGRQGQMARDDADRIFKGNQADYDRTFKSHENALDRANALERTKVASENKDATQFQAQSAHFASQMDTANNQLENILDNGKKKYDLGSTWKGIKNAVLPRAWEDEDYRLKEDSARAFVNALLRRDSGSSITDSEFDNTYKVYIPSTGDTPDILAQKKVRRDQAIKNMMSEGGKAQGLMTSPKEHRIPKGTDINRGTSPGLTTQYKKGDSVRLPDGSTWIFDGTEFEEQ